MEQALNLFDLLSIERSLNVDIILYKFVLLPILQFKCILFKNMQISIKMDICIKTLYVWKL